MLKCRDLKEMEREIMDVAIKMKGGKITELHGDRTRHFKRYVTE